MPAACSTRGPRGDRRRPRSRGAGAGRGLGRGFGGRLALVDGRFGDARPDRRGGGPPALDGVVLDIGVSSMQLDQAERGFSFRKDGPLDMRMSQAGPTAADLVNRLPEAELADISSSTARSAASRRIARAIVAAGATRRSTTTLRARRRDRAALPRPKPGQPHPATRSFQALSIAVNDELGELVARARGGRGGAEPGRLAGGRHLPFARGPHREAIPAAAFRRGAARQPARPRGGGGGAAFALAGARPSSRTRPRWRRTRAPDRPSCGSRGGLRRRRARSTARRSGCRGWLRRVT